VPNDRAMRSTPVAASLTFAPIPEIAEDTRETVFAVFASLFIFDSMALNVAPVESCPPIINYASKILPLIDFSLFSQPICKPRHRFE
jgi:hypothetical protein